MKRLFLLGSLCLLLLLSLPAAALATWSYDQSIDDLWAKNYPQSLESYFNSLGTNPDLGFRWAGTSAERAVSCRVAREMREMGLKSVRLEPVPVDVFEFKSAWVKVGDKRMVASTFGGIRPTSHCGITKDIVYVHGGTAADFDAAGDVRGKIVLVDKMMSSWWYNLPAFEATLRGAAGMIVTSSDEDPKYYSYADDALGSFDGYYDMKAIPLVYIAKADGDWLKGELAAGAVRGTMVLKEKVTLEKQGGVGFNVVGVLPGRCRNGQMILMAAHQDCHFRAGMDDTGALVNMLAIAKAMKMSGYRPNYDIVFLATTGEEFAMTNAYYEWCIGAWWAATHEHADWAGRIRVMLNLELMALKDAPLTMQSNPELSPWFADLASRYAEFLPYGPNVTSPVYSWNDQWTFTAKGAPSVEFATSTDVYQTLYHTNYEVSELIDWGYMADIAKFIYRTAGDIDSGLLPYSLMPRADDLASTVDGDVLKEAGAKASLVDRLVADVTAFQTTAAAYDAAAPSIPGSQVPAANRALLAIERVINHNFTALTPYDLTIYPHEQVLGDTQGINAALASLQASPVAADAALDALVGTYLTWYGINFSHEAYLWEIERHDPDYYRINWGVRASCPSHST